MQRRHFLKLAAAAAGGVVASACSAPRPSTGRMHSSTVTAASLPKGAAPAALPVPHFPDRLHAFVWRNWPLVPAERLASVVGATKEQLAQVARSMGLGEQPRITAEQQSRSYITVIKRNWHLLPYDQLLTLLNYSAAELAYTLREDDFLYVKLGNLKPQCEALAYEPPSPAAVQRAAEIAILVRQYFGEPKPLQPREPLFSFVNQLASKPAPSTSRRTPASESLRFCYSYFALYGDPLLDENLDPYPDGYLGRLADAGVNGVWLQAVLYRMARFPWDPSQSLNFGQRLAGLRRLTERAARRGIRLYLYLNEPRAMPLSFFKDRPGLKGAVEGDFATLCTSLPEVREYLASSVATICRAAPALGGFFTISASENLTNCWSHGGGASCPRCATRSPAEVIAEVNAAMYEGVHSSGSVARFIAWDWGWDDAWAPEAIKRLPAAITLQSVSEWRLPIRRGEVNTEVGEYSLSAIGPGPRAPRHWKLAVESGHRVSAKIQAANTWELSSVPYIPAVENTALHAENLRRAGVSDVMLGWTLGGYPSPNLEVVGEVLNGATAQQGLRSVAKRLYGSTLAESAVQAWREFSVAFREFPYHIGTVYSGPQQLGPANLLWAAPTGYAATMVGFPYDDLDAWRSVYPPHIYVQQLEKVAEGFSHALSTLKLAGQTASDRSLVTAAQSAAFSDLCRVAEAVELHYRSSANQAKFVLARPTAIRSKSDGVPSGSVTRLQALLEEEIALACRLHVLQEADSRLGFEASNHYFYVPVDLMEKVVNCRYLLDTWVRGLE